MAGPEPTGAGADDDGALSDDLLDETEEDEMREEEENRPPNFIPETPVAVQPVRANKGNHSLPVHYSTAGLQPWSYVLPGGQLGKPCELSFLPESQSSPLPTSVLRHQSLNQFKVRPHS